MGQVDIFSSGGRPLSMNGTQAGTTVSFFFLLCVWCGSWVSWERVLLVATWCVGCLPCQQRLASLVLRCRRSTPTHRLSRGFPASFLAEHPARQLGSKSAASRTHPH